MKRSNFPALSAVIGATLGVSFFLGATVLAADSNIVQLHGGPERASLLELYTSEGCSSCPPAEAWLSRLRDDPRLWKEIVPVAFHVDYWDNLGWKDRFASAAFTARQREHAARWNSGSVYTPGFVLDGREWRDWFSQRGLTTTATQTANAPGLLSVSVPTGGKTATATYRAAASSSAGAREVFLALLGFDVKSDVKAGENRGRALTHDFVALSCEKQTLPAKDGVVEFRLAAKPAGVGRLALAAWVVKAGASEPEQAVGGWLPW